MSDNTAQFNFYLNRQGVTGKQGAKGEKGFSPVISVEKDTLSEYILRITNESSYFLTTNLRESKEDRGGTYIRYDRDQGVMYAGDADRASKTQYGEVRFATAEEITAGDENTVITPADLEDVSANFVTINTDQSIEANKTLFGNLRIPYNSSAQKGSIITNASIESVNIPIIEPYDTNGSFRIGAAKDGVNASAQNGFDINNNMIDGLQGVTYYEQGQKGKIIADFNIDKYVKAGDNVTIDKGSDGSLTISSTGGGQAPEDVALKSADQTFTGHNYFNGQVNFNGTVQFTNQQIEIPKLHSSNKITGVNIRLESAGQSYKFPCEKGTISLSATSGDDAGTTAGLYISGAGIDNKRLLTEGDASILPQANATTLGGVKANPKTDEDTQAVNIDPATGLLYTKAGGEGSANTVFNSASPILINQNCNPYINNKGFYILENSYNNNGSNNITINDYDAISGLPTSGTITLNIQNVTGNKTDWDNNVLGFDITDPNNAKIYAGDATQGFAKFIVLCNKSGNNVTPLYIAVGDDSRVGPYNIGDANACLLNNIEFQNIQDNKGIYNANIKQIINNTPYNMQNFFVIILVDLNIIQLMCVGTDGEEHLLYNVSGLTDLANINYAYVLSGSITTKFNKDTVYSIVDEQKIYPTIIRNATDVNISLKYSNKFVLNNGALDLANTITTQGNTFNGASQLVQLDSSGKLPAIDGSQLTNLPAGSTPTNMVTTDTAQTITGQKIFKNSFVSSDGTATTGNRVLINNASIDLISNAGVAATIDYEGIDLRGGINSSGLSLQSSSQLITFGQNNTPMRIYASQLERYSNGNDNGAVILDAKNFSTVAPTGNLKYWTGTEAAYTELTSKDADTLYRTTDTNKVFLGTIQIGGNA